MSKPVRVPYLVMAIQVEMMYRKEFPETDLKAIEEHCLKIQSFIQACGWSEDQYIDRWMSEQDG